jgi:acetoin utilization protein AcuB
MFVRERMSHPVISIPPDLPVADALTLMKREHIRRAPVVRDGKLVGIVSDRDLFYASPSPATSLSIWEVNYLLSKILAKDVMTRNVLTVSPDTPIEEAARIMADNKIGGLPVVEEDRIVGIITETDLFKIFLELMGAREKGVRATVEVHDRPGQLAELTRVIYQSGGNILSFGQFSGHDSSSRTVTFKVVGVSEEKLREELGAVIKKVVDLRTT